MAAGWNRFNSGLNPTSQTADNAANNDATGSLLHGTHHKQPPSIKATSLQRDDIGNLMSAVDERIDHKLDELMRVMKEHFAF